VTAARTSLDLRDIVGPAFGAGVVKVRENDLLGLAGSDRTFLLSFFPFLIFLVALAGLVLDDPNRCEAS
jgi:hypothetical protein